MADLAVQTTTATETARQAKKPWLWNVVLLDDDHHTYEYVIEMVQRLFGSAYEHAYQVAKTVDDDGRAICLTTHREVAELKLEQIIGYGRDPRMASSVGSMSALIEPAESPDNDDD